MDIFSLHMNATYTLHVYHIHYMYYNLLIIMCMCIAINAAVNSTLFINEWICCYGCIIQ